MVIYCSLPDLHFAIQGRYNVTSLGDLRVHTFLSLVNDTYCIAKQVASATATFVMMFSSSLSVVEFYFLHRFPIPFGKSMALQVCLKFSIHFSMYGCSHSKNVHCFLYLKLAISSSFLYWLDSGASAWFERLCMCSREHR